MKNNFLLVAALVVASLVIFVNRNQSNNNIDTLYFSAVPGQKGGQDQFGPYEVVDGWPQDIAELPGNEAWTYGAGQSVFAESPDRIFFN